jgi:S1-C subfamily serine protease
MVDFDIPYPTSGVKDTNYIGVGTVIDAQRGLVLVDRDTVPVMLGDLTLTFAGAVRVRGRPVFMHPVHDLAVISYDPADLGDTPVEAIPMSQREVGEGDRVWMVGLNGDHEVVHSRTRIERHEPVLMGAARTPRFRDTNVDGFRVKESAPSLGGVLVDRAGAMVALWASFLDQSTGDRMFAGMPLDFIRPVTEPLLAGDVPTYRALGVEVVPISLPIARDRGLSDTRVRAAVLDDVQHVMEVRRRYGGSPASELLRDADLLLDVDGVPVTRMVDLEMLNQRAAAQVTILRDGEELTLQVPTVSLEGKGTSRVVQWGGMIVHESHHDVSAQRGIEAAGVYIAWLWYGSPAQRFGIRPTRRITAVDDRPTPDLDAFLDAVDGLEDRSPVRLTTEALDGSVRVQTLKLDLRYWPTQAFELGEAGWSGAWP